jgi:hypothetical protein
LTEFFFLFITESCLDLKLELLLDFGLKVKLDFELETNLIFKTGVNFEDLFEVLFLYFVYLVLHSMPHRGNTTLSVSEFLIINLKVKRLQEKNA